MAGEWKPTLLSSVLSFSNGKASPDRADGLPYPVYGANGIIGFAREANADPDTIVIGRVGSYCGSLYFSEQKCWVTDNAIRANALDDNDARFLFYLLQTLDLNHWRAGSGQPLLNQTILSAIPASIPEPNEQRAIAHILGTLDDKIELNQRMNETLEAMARAMFKSWFADFDPVRAKAEGRDPGLPSPLADLFPDRLVDSELGESPEGWAVRRIEDIAERVGMGPFGSSIKVEAVS
jgi:type I restriction enzyme S subunit